MSRRLVFSVVLCLILSPVLSASPAIDDSGTVGASPSQIEELEVDGSPIQGLLTQDEPFVFYSFQVPADGVYIIETFAVRGVPFLDTVLYLSDQADFSTTLEFDDDDGVGRYSRIERRLSAGEYFAAVGGFNSATGRYQIRVTSGEIPPTVTPTRPRATATPTPTQTPISDDGTTLLTVDAGVEVFEFTQANDQTIFRFVPPRTDTYVIETSAAPGVPRVDTVIALFGPNSRTRLLASNDDADSLYSRITTQLGANRTYYLAVREYNGATGSYQLEVRSGTVEVPTQSPTPTTRATSTPRPTLTPTPSPTPTQTPVNRAPVIRVEPDSLTLTVQGNRVTSNAVARVAPQEQDYTIFLNTGNLNEGDSVNGPSAISTYAARPSTRYALLQFVEVPTAEERLALADSGIHLLQYIPNNAYWARIDDGAASLASIPMGGGIRWAEASNRVDKLAPAVREGNVPTYAILGSNRIVLNVSVLPGVDQAEATQALAASGAIVMGWIDTQSVEVSTTLDGADAVSAVDLVEWVDFASPPIAENNQTAARILNVNPVYNAPYNLSGDGVRVGVWDAGSIYPHRDFGNRLTQRETNPRVRGDDHATHVGGSVGGAGTSNSQARGMAPRSLIDSYDWNSDTSEMRSSVRNGVRLSNHSYGYVIGWTWDRSKNDWEDIGNTRLFGTYTTDSRDWDSVVQRQGLIVFKAAGNDRCDGPDFERCSGRVDGPYDIIGPQAGAKNVITIGATDDLNNMSGFSCWGPTDDGRIKPDVCANGVSVFSTLPGNSHGGMSGTSMASPVACGIGTLLFELFARENGEEPDAAMIKALLIHGARDRGPAGPDYSYGFGVIDAKASADLVIGDKWRADKLEDRQTKTYTVSVQAGLPVLKTTLVWTDAPGSPSSTRALVNNLDVKLISPSGQEWLPYVLNGFRPEELATRGVNSIDNVEQIEVPNPEVGVWTIEVNPTRIAQGDGDFVLICDAFGTETEADSSFRIFNDGNAPLRINAMPISNAPWLSLEPGAPLVIDTGDSAKVTVSVNPDQVPNGRTLRRISLFSNDEDKNPYPDGVDIITIRDDAVAPTATPPPRPTPTPVPPSTLTVPTDGSRLADRIGQQGERDRYTFVAPSTGLYVIETHPVEGQSALDTVMSVFGPNSSTRLLGSNDDGGVNFYSKLELTLAAGNTFEIEVQAYNDASTGSYSISVTSPSNVAQPTPQPPQSARSLSLNAQPVTGQIDPALDQDWYSFRATTAGEYTIETLQVSGQPIMDTIMDVYDQLDENSNLLGSNDDITNTNRFSRLTLSLQQNQTVFINVSGYQRSTGVYSIRVRR